MEKQQIKLTDEELTEKILKNKYNCPYCNSVLVVKIKSLLKDDLHYNTMRCFNCIKRWFYIPELKKAETQDYDEDEHHIYMK